MTETLVFTGMLLLVLVWTSFVLFVLSCVSGWRALARRYAPAPRSGETHMSAVRLGCINYVVVASFEPEQIVLRLPWPLGFAHGPIAIPKDAVRLSKERAVWTRKRVAFIAGTDLKLRASSSFFEAAGISD